jgi:hypothetical protein
MSNETKRILTLGDIFLIVSDVRGDDDSKKALSLLDL